MSKATKIWLIVAAVMIACGLILFGAALVTQGLDFDFLQGEPYELHTHPIAEPFESISIDVDTTDITFAVSEDGCRIECLASRKLTHTASVREGTLYLQLEDDRQWYDYISFFSRSPKMTVFLPQGEYDRLTADTDTGDLTIPADFTFQTISIEGDTADITCLAPAMQSLELEVDTGDVLLKGQKAGEVGISSSTGDITLADSQVGRLELETDTGWIRLENVTCTSLEGESETGDQYLQAVTATAELKLCSNTGDIRLNGCDAASLQITTSTGDVTGTLLTEKVFLTKTATGDVSVPQTVSGGRCEITTSTGDITIRLP